jgi:hypothetical protein
MSNYRDRNNVTHSAAQAELDEVKEQVDSLSAAFHEYLAGSEVTIQKVVRAEVEHEVERWKLAVGTASKLLAVAVVLVGGLLTLFALKTAHDISLATTAAVHEQVARKIGSDDPKTPFNTALTRAVVDSYLLTMERNRILSDPTSRPAALAPGTLAQLIGAFRSQATKEADFRDVAKVLAGTNGTDSWQTALQALADAVQASDRDYAWFKDQPTRRSYVLYELNNVKQMRGDDKTILDRIDTSARSLATDSSNRSDQIMAIRYLGSHGSLSDLSALEEASRSSDDNEIQLEAGYALARLQPNSDQCNVLTKRLLSQPVTLTNASHMLIFAEQLLDHADRNAFFPEDRAADRKSREDAAATLIQRALQGNLRFAYHEGFGQNDFGQLMLWTTNSAVGDPRLSELVMQDSRRVLHLLVERSPDIDTLAKAVELFSVRGGESFFDDRAAYLTVVHLRVDADTQVMLKDGPVTLESLASDVELYPVSTGGIEAAFRTKTGDVKIDRVVGISKIKPDAVGLNLSRVLIDKVAFADEDDNFNSITKLSSSD